MKNQTKIIVSAIIVIVIIASSIGLYRGFNNKNSKFEYAYICEEAIISEGNGIGDFSILLNDSSLLTVLYYWVNSTNRPGNYTNTSMSEIRKTFSDIHFWRNDFSVIYAVKTVVKNESSFDSIASNATLKKEMQSIGSNYDANYPSSQTNITLTLCASDINKIVHVERINPDNPFQSYDELGVTPLSGFYLNFLLISSNTV